MIADALFKINKSINKSNNLICSTALAILTEINNILRHEQKMAQEKVYEYGEQLFLEQTIINDRKNKENNIKT